MERPLLPKGGVRATTFFFFKFWFNYKQIIQTPFLKTGIICYTYISRRRRVRPGALFPPPTCVWKYPVKSLQKKKHYNPNVQIRGTFYVETYVITLSASSLFATPAVDAFISA